MERQVIAAARQGANMRQLLTESETGTIDVNCTQGEDGGYATVRSVIIEILVRIRIRCLIDR